MKNKRYNGGEGGRENEGRRVLERLRKGRKRNERGGGRGHEGRRKNRGIGGRERDRERKEDVEEIPEV